jgi:fluoroacetyl-CoA thioesterase
MDTLKIGMTTTLEWEVTENRTTTRGPYKVFSTPSMTQLVEASATQLIAPHLKPGQGQVGMSVSIRHMAPTPMGKKVRSEIEVVGIDRRRVSLKAKVFDEVEQIGAADHDRFVIDLDKYFDRLKKKFGA